MIREVGIFILIIFLFSGVFASCNETQVDINTANLTELDKIKWVGLATAEKIIQLRPFSSLDELVNVSGISEGRLEDIKSQGLACVSQETAEGSENTSEEENEIIEQIPDNSTTETSNNPSSITSSKPGNKESSLKSTTKAITLNIIELNSKDIKSEDNKEILKKNLALGGIVTFCVLFGGLFFLKFARRKQENEFR